jgi:hypothetical protein
MMPREAAQDYMRRGIPVFPCEVNGKKPATAHGFKDAGTDPRVIETWHPECNIAFSPGSMGWLVVDLDGSAGYNNWRLLEIENGVPETLRVRTPSGGTHIYFRGEGPSSASAIGKGIDTRGIGGYVLLPPSLVNGGFYTFLNSGTLAPPWIAGAPEWLLAALAKPIRFERIAPAGFIEDQEYATSWAKHLIQRAIARGDLPFSDA